jgi:hypothetical protein
LKGSSITSGIIDLINRVATLLPALPGGGGVGVGAICSLGSFYYQLRDSFVGRSESGRTVSLTGGRRGEDSREDGKPVVRAVGAGQAEGVAAARHAGAKGRGFALVGHLRVLPGAGKQGVSHER